MIINNRREIGIARIALIATLALLAGLYYSLVAHADAAWHRGNYRLLAEIGVFAVAVFFMSYSNLLYQLCLIGYYKRRHKHRPATREALQALYNGNAPSLSILIPSYKEERSVIWQTLLSAALGEYPKKNVVLLIDDPYRPRVLEDMMKLEDTRRIPGELQALFDAPAAHYRGELAEFCTRRQSSHFQPAMELNRLSMHYDNVALWLEKLTLDFINERQRDALAYTDKFFLNAIIQSPAMQHKILADDLRQQLTRGETPDEAFLHSHYRRLVGLFSVNFSSFERKKYGNLSQEANKAMNLNSYIGLMGKSWQEVEVKGGWHLRECRPEEADFIVPGTDYVNTLDADSLMLSDYALRLIHIMEQPENHKLAVIQSPCSSFPGCPSGLERVAGACIDVQFLTHQGYTHWNATYWVGANALLRRRALEDIKEVHEENGHPIAIYIQDRTVIEDTESTIDLVHKGWKLYNYPVRMTFSATPPDFGSLLIQRRRWANGGFIILPKLLRYAINAPKSFALLKEMLMRFNYLASTSIGCAIAFLFFCYPFSDFAFTPLLPLATLPFLFLYARDMKNAGYTYGDALRVCSLNLMLFPVVTGGVLKQFQQMLTGKKIPFGRTPKVTGRTAAPAFYCLLEVALLIGFCAMTLHHITLLQWSQAAFSALNAGFLFYAVVYFMGMKETLQDLFAGLTARWRATFHTAEIIPLFTARWTPISLLTARKRA